MKTLKLLLIHLGAFMVNDGPIGFGYGAINYTSLPITNRNEALGASAASEEEKIFVYQSNHLQVHVDQNPIGGFRGKVGTLTINHVEHKVFTDWSDEDLLTLADLTQKILSIQEQANVRNTLIFGRQNGKEDFKLSFVVYPSCTWIEKIQGLYHAIFGSPSLTEKEESEINQFYTKQFQEYLWRPISDGGSLDGKLDPFCRPDVIEKQHITDFSFDENHYLLMHDNRPKGASVDDPHFLIIPEGNSGHCDGSRVSQKMRMDMFKIAQKAMEVLLQEKGESATLLFLERNGKELQGVQHKHEHVIGTANFPISILEKTRVFLRQLYPSSLSQSTLDNKRSHFLEYGWYIQKPN
jgi:diadenosine tetraphosphate (Ap4A) HIT family hydrolase